jgi:hypothetical protein
MIPGKTVGSVSAAAGRAPRWSLQRMADRSSKLDRAGAPALLSADTRCRSDETYVMFAGTSYEHLMLPVK